MSVTRRRLLQLGLSLPVLGGLYVGGWWQFKVRKGDANDIIIAIIRKRLQYLQIDDKELAKFSEDYQSQSLGGYRSIASWAGIMEPAYQYIEIFRVSSYSQDRFERFEQHVISTFLLSSDFFENNAREDRELKYIALYPHNKPCANPFAQIEII